MAENDIYKSKEKYEKFKVNLNELLEPTKQRKYICQNPINLEYFKKLFRRMEALDLSYMRRMRLLQTSKVIVHCTKKDLKDLTRDDIDEIVSFANDRMNAKTASDFRIDIKYIWKSILPEPDERGRFDETEFPYIVRHLRGNIDKSKQKTREDRITWGEFERILDYFSNKPCIQAYLMISVESLARPQELMWRTLKDIELHDNYAKINLSSHGKEGTGILQCIDSYAYLVSWLSMHPFRKDANSFLFVNEIGTQCTPYAINKHLRIACRKLSIKRITCYSLKRNGVTFRRLRGDSDIEIQHAARWTSTQQLKTYDLSNQEDAFKIELIKRGMIKADKDTEHLLPKSRTCSFCKFPNKFTDSVCMQCKRPLDREQMAVLEKEKEIKALEEFMNIPQMQELFKVVYELKRKADTGNRILT